MNVRVVTSNLSGPSEIMVLKELHYFRILLLLLAQNGTTVVHSHDHGSSHVFDYCTFSS